MPTTVGFFTFIRRINISTPVGPLGGVLWEELLEGEDEKSEGETSIF